MGKTRGVHETTPELRNRMVGMYEAGLGLRDIAAAVNCSQRTVKRWLNRFDKEGTVETRERCGRKRATTSEQDEAIIRLATQTPITAAKAVLPALGLTCSVDTIRERLHKAGIHNWSPSRKHMQRIPLGSEGDGATIQQAVWRPTGTQLGKKRILAKQSSGKSRRNNGPATKKRQRPVKVRARDVYVGDGAPANALKQPGVQPGFVFPQENVQQQSQQQQPPQSAIPQGNSDIQVSSDPIPTNQTQYGNALSLVQPAQPVYQHHPGLNLAQNWPLDLVQGSHHYPQGQPHSMSHEQPPQQQQFQELHTQREQEHRAQQQRAHQQRMQEQQQVQQQQLQTHHQQHLEQHRIDQQVQQQQQQQQHQQQQQQQQQQIHQQSESSIVDEQSRKMMRSDSCSNSSSSNDQLSDCDDLSKDGSKDDCGESGCGDKRKKKGGKAKGTLETSVEIRNRMIGMSVAGLSTLSIALAINRSERTVKRWLERWNKEGNVQTKERKGRRRITTKEQDDAIIAMATQHPLTAAKHVAPALGLNCSVDTIRERLHKAGIHSWKLGKKQGEGNAVHTVHLWQPSGNRPNKPKLPSERRRKSSNGKKRTASSNTAPKRTSRKKKTMPTTMTAETLPVKIISPPANMISEPPTMQFHDNGVALANYVPATEMIQSVHDLSVPPQPLVPPPPPTGSQGPQPGPQPMQAMDPLMQQRPDCRMVPTIVPPVPGHANSGVYPSCMVSNNSHTSHMEQPDPLNYEPYIWSF